MKKTYLLLTPSIKKSYLESSSETGRKALVCLTEGVDEVWSFLCKFEYAFGEVSKSLWLEFSTLLGAALKKHQFVHSMQIQQATELKFADFLLPCKVS